MKKQKKLRNLIINKNIPKKIYILLGILTIMSFYLFLGTFNAYKNRNEIMINEEPISNYKIIKFRCSASYGNATIYILYNSKEYTVEINPYYCVELKNKQTRIDFFYDKKKNKIFTKSELTKNMVIITSIIFLFFISIWFIPRRYW